MKIIPENSLYFQLIVLSLKLPIEIKEYFVYAVIPRGFNTPRNLSLKNLSHEKGGDSSVAHTPSE